MGEDFSITAAGCATRLPHPRSGRAAAVGLRLCGAMVKIACMLLLMLLSSLSQHKSDRSERVAVSRQRRADSRRSDDRDVQLLLRQPARRHRLHVVLGRRPADGVHLVQCQHAARDWSSRGEMRRRDQRPGKCRLHL